MILALWLGACTAGDAAPPPVDTSLETDTWDTFAAGFFLSYCQSCHASAAPDRFGAPPTVTFDTEAEARALADRVLGVIGPEDARMPPGGGVDPDEIARLRRWFDVD